MFKAQRCPLPRQIKVLYIILYVLVVIGENRGDAMGEGPALLDEVSVTEARQMRQHYDNVVHGKRPFLMTRYRDPGAVVMSRET